MVVYNFNLNKESNSNLQPMTLTATHIAENLAHIRAEITVACQRAERDPETVTLVGVSKTRSAALVLEAAAAGITDFGENRVEEAGEKIPQVNTRLPADQPPIWHLIGHVQSRKVKDLFVGGQPLFDLIHSVDSVKLASKLSRIAEENHITMDVLLQMNVSGEASKEGFDAAGWGDDPAIRARLWQDFSTIRAMPGLQVSGLMTIAPIVTDLEQVRPVFRQLRTLRDALSESFGAVLIELSMG
ncbi:MAG TPA: YggS family pyridoxal phosphate-dependent enzyme, partial [Phototrophicaceae bacterium]|nr:YggS family pyridoxal phosphate-dependent enzyme [Phototrophicaceae bacterium]